MSVPRQPGDAGRLTAVAVMRPGSLEMLPLRFAGRAAATIRSFAIRLGLAASGGVRDRRRSAVRTLAACPVTPCRVGRTIVGPVAGGVKQASKFTKSP